MAADQVLGHNLHTMAPKKKRAAETAADTAPKKAKAEPAPVSKAETVSAGGKHITIEACKS